MKSTCKHLCILWDSNSFLCDLLIEMKVIYNHSHRSFAWIQSSKASARCRPVHDIVYLHDVGTQLAVVEEHTHTHTDARARTHTNTPAHTHTHTLLDSILNGTNQSTPLYKVIYVCTCAIDV
jgi:hypothetical protein